MRASLQNRPARDRRVWPVRPRAARGITLLELLIVLALLGLILGLSINALSKITRTKLRTETNKLAAAFRHTFNRSSTHGLYMRMVIDLDADAYWVEASDQPMFLAEKKRGVGEEEDEDKEAEGLGGGETPSLAEGGLAAVFASPRARYQADGVIPRTSFEKPIQIDGVLTTGQDDVFRAGKAYIHFFPNGFVEPAMVYTTNGEGDYFTLILDPLSGRVKNRVGRVDSDSNWGQPDKVEDEGR